MKIERIEITHHQLELDPPFPAAWDSRPRTRFPVTIVRVFDDAGHMGVGSGDELAGFGTHCPLFLGRDPLDLDRHAAVLANLDFLGARPWPFDVALWDLAGQIRHEPVWRMAGGSGNRVRPYASMGVHRDPDASAEQVRRALEAGFRAVKLRFGRPRRDEDLATLRAVRSEVGDGLELMVDCNQGWRMPWDTRPPWSFEEALRVATELSELGVRWMEEPLPHGDHEGMARLRETGLVPIAGGELTRELHEFRAMLERGSLDVYQPDVVLTVGMAGLRELAREVAARGHLFSPHTWGNGLGLVANLHLTAGSVGAPYLEYPWDPPEWTPERRDFPLERPFEPDADGWLTLGDDPGLGIRLDEDRLAATRSDRATYD